MSKPLIQIDNTENWPFYFSQAWAFYVDRGKMLSLMLDEIMSAPLEAKTFSANSGFKTIVFKNETVADYYGKVDGEDITKWNVNKLTINFASISGREANGLSLTFEGKFKFGSDFLISNGSTFSAITINDPNSILAPGNFEFSSPQQTLYGGLTSWTFSNPTQNIYDSIKQLSRSLNSDNVIGTSEFNSEGKVTTLVRVDNGNTVLKLSNYDSVDPKDYMDFDKITKMLLGNNIIKPIDPKKAVYIDGKSGDDTISGGDNDDVLIGGDGNDNVRGGRGNEIIVGGSGAGNDTYDGGADVDTIVFTSALAGITVDLNKGSARSTITNQDAGIGIDKLSNIENVIAGDYADYIVSSKVSNEMTGGKGSDTFVFATRIGAKNIDTITDFVSGEDKIALDDAIFKKLNKLKELPAINFKQSTSAEAATDYIIYDNTTGKLYYDADGNGKGLALQIAVIGNNPDLSASDFMIV